MPVYASVEVVGLKEALKELNRFNKKLRRQITRDYKQITKPIEQDAKAELNRIGDKPPLSGWGRAWNPAKKRAPFGGRKIKDVWAKVEAEERRQQAIATGGVFPWDTDAAKRMVKAKINTKQPREFAGKMQNLQIFTLSWLGAANEVFEMAGRESSGKTEQGKQMIQALNARWGQPGRVLWKAYDKNRDVVDKEMRALVERVMAAVNRTAVFSERGEVR
jgi:hypothetical protein